MKKLIILFVIAIVLVKLLASVDSPSLTGGLVAAQNSPPPGPMTFTVTKTADTNDGTCDTDCSLREAIVAANANPGLDTIAFTDLPNSPDLYTLTIDGTGEDAAATGDLDITEAVTITGNGQSETIIQAGTTPADGADPGIDRVFHILFSDVVLERVTVRHGQRIDFIDDSGGGIFNQEGFVSLISSTVSNNLATQHGGGIFSLGGTVELTDSTVKGNTADEDGGGVFIVGATLTLINSTVSDNTASDGGGIYSQNVFVSLISSTVSNNLATQHGGGIFSLGGTVELTDSTVKGNTADEDGGGVRSDGGTVLTLINSTVSDNTASGGGGIFNLNGVTLTLINSIVSGNNAGGAGGIFNGFFSTATIDTCTVSGNSANSDGGGIWNQGSFTVINCTVSGNSAASGGGIYIVVDGEVDLINSTVANNNTNIDGGGIFNTGTVRLTNSIVADQASGSDCGGDSVTSNGHNLDSDGSCNLNATGDLTNDPKLGPLQDNGGPTETHALLPSSPAIDAGDDANCPPTDQRGVPRPQGAACDIGAYEFVPPPVVEVSIDIKPNQEPNTINCLNQQQEIPVMILTTDNFDATTVDHTTVTFEGASETHMDRDGPIRHEDDVDRDGDTDLLFHFRLGDTDLTCDSTAGTLIGETFDGQAIEGTDSVLMKDRR